MSTHDSLIELTDTLIQQNGYRGFSYADPLTVWEYGRPVSITIFRPKPTSGLPIVNTRRPAC